MSSTSEPPRKRNRFEENSPTRNGITSPNLILNDGIPSSAIPDFDLSETQQQNYHACDLGNSDPRYVGSAESSSQFSPGALLDEILAEGSNTVDQSLNSGLPLDGALDSLSGMLGFPNATSVDSQYPSYSNGNSRDLYRQDSYSLYDEFGSFSSDEDNEQESLGHMRNSGQEFELESGEEVSDLDDNDVDAMLEDIDGTEKADGSKTPLVVSKERFFLVDRSDQLFEFLPEGWVKAVHQSGMPVYYHRLTKVCCLSRPYELSRGALRTHKIPVSSVPCLEYRKAKEEEKAAAQKLAVENQQNGGPEEPNTCPVGDSAMPSAQLVSADEHLQKSLITPVEFRDYCSKLFDFETKVIRRYKNWKVGRGRQKLVKKMRNAEQPDQNSAPATMLKNSKVVTISRGGPDGKAVVSFILNPANKTPVSILHEFVQHTRKTQPTYAFLEMPDSNTPYEAIITIDGKEEGRGFGSSKKAAKLQAAKAAISKLVPELRSVVDNDDALARDEEIFRDIAIDDARVMEIAFKAGIAGPYQILTNALRRLHAHTPDQIKFSSQRISHLKNEYTMTTPKHTASVVHEKRNEAKQIVAQKILKEMHPHLNYYGELLTLYGREYQENVKKKKETQRAITDLQGKGNWGEPNWDLLEKLRQEMKKVKPVPLGPGELSRIRYD